MATGSRGIFRGSMRRALFLLVTAVFVPMLLVVGLVFVRWFDAELAGQRSANLELARAMALTFEGFLRDIRRQELAIGTALVALHPYTPEQANQLLNTIATEHVAIRSVHWASPAGEVSASSDPHAIGLRVDDRKYFQELLAGQERVVVSDLLTSKLEPVTIFVVARAIRDGDGALQGVVIATVEPSKLGDATLRLDRPEQGQISVFDRQGTVAYLRPEPSAPLADRKWADDDPLLKEALSGRESSGTYVSPADGAERIAARVPVRRTGWVAGASRPRSEVMRDATKSLVLALGLVVLIVGGSVALAVYVANWILRSLRQLGHHAQAVGRGELDHRAEIAGVRELDDLGGALNWMADQLQVHDAALRKTAADLEHANKELESFAYSVSHDLRSPLRSIDGFSQALLDDYPDRLDDLGRDYLQRIRAASQRMGQLIDDMLMLSRVSRAAMRHETVDLSEMARGIASGLGRRQPERRVDFAIADGLTATGDSRLLQIVLENLLENAWKFTGQQDEARIEFGSVQRDGKREFFVRDNGAGFDPTYAEKLFIPFQRLHSVKDYPGTGVGLATVQRILRRHGGDIRAEGGVQRGATFFFTV